MQDGTIGRCPALVVLNADQDATATDTAAATMPVHPLVKAKLRYLGTSQALRPKKHKLS